MKPVTKAAKSKSPKETKSPRLKVIQKQLKKATVPKVEEEKMMSDEIAPDKKEVAETSEAA